MIFSRTASKLDLYNLNLYEILMEYLENPDSIRNYSSSLYRFWDYALLLKLLDFYNLQKLNILSISLDKSDTALDIISEYKKLNITQMSLDAFLKSKIKNNRYNIICCFGLLEFIEKELLFIDKVNKHLLVDGYLIITTDDSNTLKMKTITPDDLINISYFLEKIGYDFCSDELELVNYTNKSNLHSLVMQRLGQ